MLESMLKEHDYGLRGILCREHQLQGAALGAAGSILMFMDGKLVSSSEALEAYFTHYELAEIIRTQAIAL